ncbi:hypothetical protein IU449_26750 [Nocardia higoensis]|uniref:Calcineurin-like phosphoesterase domain-containing protein n=1 Tax=Nocardia higoensis TaxID=228599 RepID=A0ABS0DI57_9NOCA|nr:metallophosphoesterase [Nocardia higoensis]MBF6358099.1 hypothetical protein [Nocardia higoensis]
MRVRERVGAGVTAVWFVSDLHIQHAKVAELRGFDDIDVHDAVLAANWDRVVRDTDQVWVLGDIVGRRGHEHVGLDWLTARPGVKHLVSGNHDAVHPMHSQAHKVLRVWLEVFETIQSAATRKVLGHRVRLSHFPFMHDQDGDHTPELRHNEWRPVDIGGWLLHGHTHSNVQQRGRQLHVGVDAHDLTPVSLKWVEDRISEGVVE